MYVNIGNEQYQAEGEKMTVVGYCRLSRDEDKENYASIEEQKRILSLFGREKDLKRILILNHYLL